MKRTAIIFALFWELRPFARKMGVPFFKAMSRHIILEDRNIALIRCGMGRENAKQAAERIIKDFHPEIIVSAGFCGALVEDLKIGDIISSDLSDGKIFSSPRPLASYEDKMTAHREHKAVVVDMESEGVRIVAGKYNIPCIAIKAVSDGLKDDIPKSLFTFTSLSKLIRFKRSMDIASKRLSEFLLNYIKED
ncbi:MAG: hypothetical protein Q8R05_00370 [Candidatus Omnitrophota bacterium]|nr:hypothetical protein [Candidatus Omnitrophota bacterium]